ncbi:hypothetical protein BGW80DRAFT_1443931 [Lactifluus volemus]|nr:hypothetical protein BGW80DRAFT_1443931 [Lactifluus volemus]
MFSKSLVVSLFFLGLTSSINAIPVPRDVESDAFCVQGHNDLITPDGELVGLMDGGLNIAQAFGAGPSSQSTSGTKRSLALQGFNFKQIASDAGNVFGIVGDVASLANAFGLVAPASPSAGQKRAFGVRTASAVLLIDLTPVALQGLNFHNIASDVNNVLGVVSDGITLGQEFGIVTPPASLSAGQKRAFGGLNFHNIASDVNNVLGVVSDGITLGQEFGIVSPPASLSAGQKRAFNNVLGVVASGVTLGQDFGIVPPPASLSAGQKRAFGGLNFHNIASDVNNVLGVVASGVTLGQDFGIVPPPTQATTSAGQKREGEALEG